MERYEKKIKARLIVMGVAMALSIIMVIVSYIGYKKLPSDQHLASFVGGFQAGLFFAWTIMMIKDFIQYIRAIKNLKLLKKLHLKETDERTILIQNKARAAGFGITLVGLLLAAIVAAFYSVVVCFSLLSVFWFMCLSVGCAKFFYHRTL